MCSPDSLLSHSSLFQAHSSPSCFFCTFRASSGRHYSFLLFSLNFGCTCSAVSCSSSSIPSAASGLAIASSVSPNVLLLLLPGHSVAVPSPRSS